MCALIYPIPPMWQNMLCWECLFLFERGDDRFVPAVVILVSQDPFGDGPQITPLCAHHGEVAGADGTLPNGLDGNIPDEWNVYIYPPER